MAQSPVAVGDVLAGKYRVERIIGAGGMGVVVAAWHLELEQRVAMKFLNPLFTESGDAAERFRREARALARIKSEHVARVLDVGMFEGGLPYIVMEFLEGNDLAQELRQRGPLPLEEALEYILEAIEAVAEAHALGIVHRDLKPANLFLARQPGGSRSVKVLDFGISKSLLGASRDELSLTRTAAMIGSPLYMSTEQARSAKDVDARTDIWSLGVILYEMLTGRPPHLGESVAQLFASLLNEAPASLLQVRSDVPPQLDEVVLRCLAKERDQRWNNVGDLAYALLRFAPAECRVHVDRARRVLGMSDAGWRTPSQVDALSGRPSMHSQVDVNGRPTLPNPVPMMSWRPTMPSNAGATGEPALAGGAQVPAPRGGSIAAPPPGAVPTVSSWSSTGGAQRAARRSALWGLAIAAGAALATVAFGAVLYLRGRALADDPKPAAAAAAPAASAAEPARAEGPPGPAPAAAPGAGPSATPPPEAAAGAAAPLPEEAASAATAPPEAGPGAAPSSAAAAGDAALAPPPAPPPTPAPPPAPTTPAARPGAPQASAAPRPAARPQPPPANQAEPRGTNEISDFGGRR
ncbi:protein kinase [Sorangium cellulosum]|uniref:Protein kinase n=1 Tax=Sorangium cellulosum TaxID=56 RepID=A0A2L0FBB5_SORCE|nr:serine/threonine-protein kinase [Sorangium cellulosum]AUX48719.1 protein kinase [Sorangium cellulosum]